MTKISGRKPALLILSIHFGGLIGARQFEKASGTGTGRAESLPDHSLRASLIPACKHHLAVAPEVHRAFIAGGICASKASIHTDNLL